MDLAERLRRDRAARATCWQPVLDAQHAFDQVDDYGSAEAFEVMVRWLRAHQVRIGAAGWVVAVSGGVDSTLAALLLHQVDPARTKALLLPDSGSPDDVTDARALVDRLGLAWALIDLRPQVDGALRAAGLHRPSPLVRGNFAARLRGATQYLIANESGRLVMGTGNYDELMLGYCAKGGAVDLSPTAGLHKDEVRRHVRRELGRLDPKLGRRLARRPASPGYFPNQRAEHELGVRYDVVGRALDLLARTTRLGPAGLEVLDPTALRTGQASAGLRTDALMHVVSVMMQNSHKFLPGTSLMRSFSPSKSTAHDERGTT